MENDEEIRLVINNIMENDTVNQFIDRFYDMSLTRYNYPYFHPIINNQETTLISIDFFSDLISNNIMENNIDEGGLVRNEDVDTSNLDYYEYNDTEEKTDDICFCSIEYNNGDKVCKLACDHIFHHKCIKEWCLYKKECPVCRAEIKL